MRLSVTDETGFVRCYTLDSKTTLLALKNLAQADFKIPALSQQIYFNSVLLSNDSATLLSFGVGNDDIVLVRGAGNAIGTQSLNNGNQPLQNQNQGIANPWNNSNITTSNNPSEAMRLQILNNPQLRESLTSRNPILGASLNDPTQFARIYNESIRQSQSRAQTIVEDDPFDMDAQLRIEQDIQKRNIQGNMEIAIENHPESFGRVVMLYIPMMVNNYEVKAFVDSGAQATIMSPGCASRCNIMHLLDIRFAGLAVGVGTAKILGRIHSASIIVGGLHLQGSFTVMEGKDVDLLFGLDMLKKHQMCIDLGKNVLRIGETEIAFLTEHELPDQAKDRANNLKETNNEPEATTNLIEKKLATSNTGKYPDAIVKGLTDLGVDIKEAIAALDAAEGNPDLAADLLFQ